MPKPSKEQNQRAQALRERAKRKVQPVGGLSLREAAREVGMNNETFTQFIKGRTPGDQNMDQVEAWLDGAPDTRDTEAEPLDEWGLARARAIERLVDLLGKDQRVLELRAEAALNASIAARVEAEKAPDRSAPINSGDVEADLRAYRAWVATRGGAGGSPPEDGQGEQPRSE